LVVLAGQGLASERSSHSAAARASLVPSRLIDPDFAQEAKPSHSLNQLAETVDLGLCWNNICHPYKFQSEVNTN